jgi:hypothetical protein
MVGCGGLSTARNPTISLPVPPVDAGAAGFQETGLIQFARAYALAAFCATVNTSRADVVPATCSVPVTPSPSIPR